MLGADEQGSEFHEVLREADDLGGMPVVVADLHSALPAILAGYLAGRAGAAAPDRLRDAGRRRAARLVLPARAPRCAEAGWLAGTVTVGQAFGGDLEAVSLHSGLLAARHVLGAELAVVAQGPGNLGTGTRWGFSGRGLRRGGQRRRGARRPAGRIACGSARPTRASGTAASPTTA